MLKPLTSCYLPRRQALTSLKKILSVNDEYQRKDLFGQMNSLTIIALVMFSLGMAPLIGFVFFSPGLMSEGWLGVLIVAYALATLAALVRVAIARYWLWLFVLIQVMLLALLGYETYSGGALYIGT